MRTKKGTSSTDGGGSNPADKTPGADESLLEAVADDAIETGDNGDIAAPKDKADTEGHEPEVAARPTPVGDDARADISRSYREKRKADIQAEREKKAAEAAGDAGDGDGDAGDGDGGDAGDGAGDEPADKTKPKAVDADAGDGDDAETVAMVVDGKVVHKSRAEVQRLAQQMLQSDNRLDDAKKLLDEVKGLQTKKPDADDAGGEASPAADPQAKKPMFDFAELKDVVTQIQLADDETGAKALQAVLEKLAAASQPQAGADPDQVSAAVQQTLAQERRKTEVKEALDAFAAAYPDVAGDDILATTAATLLERELVKDLKKAGMTDEDIKPLLQSANPSRALSARQFQLRESGVKLRSFKEVVAATGQVLTEKYGFKPVVPVRDGKQPGSGKVQSRQESPAQRPKVDPAQQQQRIDQKRQQVVQQPRAAGVRGGITPPKKPKSRQEIIREMASQRGFPSTR